MNSTQLVGIWHNQVAIAEKYCGGIEEWQLSITAAGALGSFSSQRASSGRLAGVNLSLKVLPWIDTDQETHFPCLPGDVIGIRVHSARNRAGKPSVGPLVNKFPSSSHKAFARTRDLLVLRLFINGVALVSAGGTAMETLGILITVTSADAYKTRASISASGTFRSPTGELCGSEWLDEHQVVDFKEIRVEVLETDSSDTPFRQSILNPDE